MSKKSTISVTLGAGLLLLLFSVPPVRAENRPLQVGDPAPKLQCGKFVQGEPINSIQSGKVYFIEFWGTWLQPCRDAVPGIEAIYKKYKDKGVVLFGQDCGDSDDGAVKPFIKSMNGAMTYPVALDDKIGNPNGRMSTTWMEAAQRKKLPTVFIVDQTGTIAWIGNPGAFQTNYSVLDDILAGTYSMTNAILLYKKELFAADLARSATLTAQSRLDNVTRFIQEKKWDDALAELAAAEVLLPSKREDATAVRLAVERIYILLCKKDMAGACKSAANVSNTHPNNSQLQVILARELLSAPDVDQAGISLADTFVKRAFEKEKEHDALGLDTLAMLQFLKGKKLEAVETEKQAVAKADARAKPMLQARVDSYQKGVLPVTH